MTTFTEQETPLQRYVKLRAQGDREGAHAAAIEACTSTPGAPEGHYALGEMLALLGDDAGAVAAFAAALHRASNWADAWVNLGLARYRQGGIHAAKQAMRQALKAVPGHPAAAGNLAVFLRITGDSEASDALLHDSLAKTPAAHGARLNLAADLMQRGRGADALAMLDAVPSLPTAPDTLRQWHLARARAWLQLGQAAPTHDALSAFAAVGPMPPALAPLWHWRRVLLAQLENDAPAALSAAGDMDASLAAMGPDGVLEHRIIAHYDLANFWSHQGNTAIAFAHWNEGHRLLRISQPFSREAYAAFIQANITAFGAARFGEGPRAANRDTAPVFIVGMPRSGTTLCEQILSAHGDVHGAGERHSLYRTARRLGGGDDSGSLQRLSALEAATLDEEAASYLAELHALAPGKPRVVDKMPGNELYLGLVGLMLPGARIIHCVRDPRDIGLSIWTYRFYGEHAYAHDLADLGWTIGQRARLMDHWRAVLPNPILTVALQDWVKDFNGTLARVLDFLGLPPDSRCTRFYESDRDVRTVSRAQVREPINARGLGRWRACAEHLAPLIAELKAVNLIPDIAPDPEKG